MHPNSDATGNVPPKPQIYSKPPSGKAEVLQNVRRDPIGYFEDTKFGSDPVDGYQNGNSNNHMSNGHGSYQPSWNDTQSNDYSRPNELLENAMKY